MSGPQMSAALFKTFRDNISVQNAADISTSYAQITTRLNKDFWDIDSDLYHRLQVGSYGRKTAIHGISDLDMVFELPWQTYLKYKAYTNNGPSQLLQAVRDSIKTRYPNTTIKGDGQVVCIEFSKYRVEVLPAFWDEDNDGYRYGDTNNGGTWNNICKPRKEIDAVNARNSSTNRNLKHICKMIRAWKNYLGVSMSGMLIDTLVYNFFGQTDDYDTISYESYGELFISLFTYLGNLPQQDWWSAPGSGQRVKNKGKFQAKAKKAARKCQEALEADTEKKQAKIWREIFGRSFPSEIVSVEKAVALTEAIAERFSTERFIEDAYPVDIQYELSIDSVVTNNGQKDGNLKYMASIFQWLPAGRGLRFYIDECEVPAPYQLFWKVRNVGPVAERLNSIRGQIVSDGGKAELHENTSFHGEHYVEAFIIKDGICVARDKIDVRINDEH